MTATFYLNWQAFSSSGTESGSPKGAEGVSLVIWVFFGSESIGTVFSRVETFLVSQVAQVVFAPIAPSTLHAYMQPSVHHQLDLHGEKDEKGI